MNALIWALLLVSIVGPRVLAGLIAISIRSIGFCAKLLYEAIEEINVLAWPKVSLFLLVILVAVVIGEGVSAKVRGAII